MGAGTAAHWPHIACIAMTFVEAEAVISYNTLGFCKQGASNDELGHEPEGPFTVDF